MSGARRKRRRSPSHDESVSSEEHANEGIYSEVLSDALLDWAWGHTTTKQLYDKVKSAIRDGASHPELRVVEKMGAFGTNPQHLHRDLSRRYLKDVQMPEPEMLHIPAKDPVSQEDMFADMGILLPHDWFSHLFEHYPVEFRYLFSIGAIGEFWEGASRLRDIHLKGTSLSLVLQI